MLILCGVFYINNHVICEHSYSISSSKIYVPFISFTCLTVLARTSRRIRQRSGERGLTCLVPDLNEKAIKSDISHRVFIDVFYQVKEVTLYS